MTPPVVMRKRTSAEDGALSPFDEEAERAFLGFLLVDPIETLANAASLSASDVYTPIIRRAYVAALTLRANRLPVDPRSIKADMGQIKPLSDAEQDTLAEAVRAHIDGGAPDVRNVEGLARRIALVAHQRNAQRAILEAQTALARAGADGAESTGRILAGLREEIDALDEQHRAPSEAITPWIACADVLAMPEDDCSGHYWFKTVAPGVFTLFSGYPKAGKSWLIHALAAELGRGGTWAGKQLPKVPTLYLTEESPGTLRSKIVRFGIEGVEYFPLGRRNGLPWPAVVSLAVERAKQTGAGLLIVDTLSAWTDMGPDDEQKEGPVRAALAPLVNAAHAHGLAVIGVHHMRKQDGDGGRASRGSSAFGQVPDVIAELRPFGGEDSPQRSVKVYGRFDDMPPESIFTLHRSSSGPSYYELMGTASAARSKGIEDRVLEVLTEAGAWLSEPGVVKRAERRKDAVGAALRDLYKVHTIQRKKAARAFLYAIKGTTLEAPTLPDDPDADVEAPHAS